MITSSIVLYKSKRDDVETVIQCAGASVIDEIYVVDNSPGNELETFVRQLSPKVTYLFSGKNTGYSAGHNTGIRRAIQKGSLYHVVLNPDIVFDKSTIGQIVGYMDRHPEIGQLLPKVVYPGGEIQYLCKLIPTPFDLIFKRFIPAKLTERRLRKFQLQFTGYNKEMNIPYLSGCFMFFRVSALRKVGLFDERFFMYPEDIDMTRRMHRFYKTLFYPQVTIIHAHAAESYKSRKMLWIHINNMIRYFNKWGWIFDRERTLVNRKVLRELGYNK